jgi:hypothetical protein
VASDFLSSSPVLSAASRMAWTIIFSLSTSACSSFDGASTCAARSMGQLMHADRIMSFHAAAVQGSITVRPAAANALASRDATAKSCAAAIAAI